MGSIKATGFFRLANPLPCNPKLQNCCSSWDSILTPSSCLFLYYTGGFFPCSHSSLFFSPLSREIALMLPNPAPPLFPREVHMAASDLPKASGFLSPICNKNLLPSHVLVSWVVVLHPYLQSPMCIFFRDKSQLSFFPYS